MVLPPKIIVTDEIIHNIKSTRIAKRIPAAKLSRALNRDDSYISSLELSRIRTISTVDYVAILSYLFDIPEQEAVKKAEEDIGVRENENGFENLDDLRISPECDFSGMLMVSEPTIEYRSANAVENLFDTELINDLLAKMVELITSFYKEDPKEAVFALSSFTKLLQTDIIFSMELMGLPLYSLKDMGNEERAGVLKEISEVIKRISSGKS